MTLTWCCCSYEVGRYSHTTDNPWCHILSVCPEGRVSTFWLHPEPHPLWVAWWWSDLPQDMVSGCVPPPQLCLVILHHKMSPSNIHQHWTLTVTGVKCWGYITKLVQILNINYPALDNSCVVHISNEVGCKGEWVIYLLTEQANGIQTLTGCC